MRYYLSHSIQGKYGEDATPTQMKEACDQAIEIANRIRTALPSVELYVPAEHEDFVGISYADKYLTRDQILEIDCKIIDRCDGVIVFSPPGDPIQGGRATEREHAVATSKQVLVFSHEREAIKWLTDMIVRA